MEITSGAARLAAEATGTGLPGVAHLPHLERDERTLAEITDFVAS